MVHVFNSLDCNQVMQIKLFLREQFHQTADLDEYIKEVNMYYEGEMEPYYLGMSQDGITGLLILDAIKENCAYGRVFTKDNNFLKELKKIFSSNAIEKLYVETQEFLPEVVNLHFDYAEYMMTLFPEGLDVTLTNQTNELIGQDASISLIPVTYKDKKFYENILKDQHRMSQEDAKERFESLLIDKAMHGFLVWLDRLKPIGICAYYEDSTFLTLFDLTILPNYQNKGYGKAMLLKLLSQTRSKQVKYLLQVTSTNTFAFHMYQQAGFHITQQQLYYEFEV